MMNLDEIKIKWTLKENDKKSNISLWDEKADYFGNYAIPTIEEDKFLKLLKDEKILNKKFKVLDVGCGGGKYSLALANECDEILGIDLSPKMIEYANKNRENFNIKNASFLCENWHDINVKKTNLYRNFDDKIPKSDRYGIYMVDNNRYKYFLCMKNKENNMKKITIEGGKYAVFNTLSRDQDNIVKMYKFIYNEWIASTNYKVRDDLLNFEYYYDDNCYIYVPIR